MHGAMPSEGPLEPDPEPGTPPHAGRRSRSSKARRWSWLIIFALVVVALVRNEVAAGPSRTADERVQAIASQMKCPVCKSQSVANSDSPAAKAIKVEVSRRVALGEADGEIRAAIASTYGSDVQLTPSASGFAGLVWILPVVALVVALAVLSGTFARWRRSVGSSASAADQSLVADALRKHR